MRISDWSSDVCSSDLAHADDAEPLAPDAVAEHGGRPPAGPFADADQPLALGQPSLLVCVHHLSPACAAIKVNEIGRASCRERVCQYVYISVVAVSLKKKLNTSTTRTRNKITNR